MSAYKPRSGTFRKVKYPLEIYKTNEIPHNDLKHVLEMVEKIKAEETLDSPQYQFDDEAEECRGRLPDMMKKKMENLKLSPERADESRTVQPEVAKTPKTLPPLPEAQFSVLPDSLYNQCYADDDSLPKFPVTSSGVNFSDAEESGHDSEYDMDTEDEEWLEANDKLNITPNRLEYIFSKLNKRDTHVQEKAVGALPEAFHNDFHHLFPYWKEKRLQNKNVSTFKPKCNQTDSKKDGRLSSGYITSDPYVIFACNPRKSLPQNAQQLKVSQKFNKRDVKTYLKRMLEAREKLANVRAWASETFHRSLNDRDEIVNNFATLMKNQGTPSFGKENPDLKLKASSSNQVSKSVDSAFIPIRVPRRLTIRPDIEWQESSVILKRRKVAPHPSKEKAAEILQTPRRLRLSERKNSENYLSLIGTGKNKGDENTGRHLRIQQAAMT